MEYRILGPLEVVERGHELPLGGARQRALLAVLLLHRREIVSVDHLTEALWGDDPPLTAAKTIQVYVSRLRKVLGTEVVETCGRGYRLAVDPDSCDLDRFEASLARGRSALESGDAPTAAALLGEALALWRDPALDEFSAEPFAQAELPRLVEERLAVLEDRIDAELAMGRGPELVRELERLAADHPSRERLAAALMLALYRAGRQADALAVYHVTRRRLVEELGLEPSPRLRELERRILQHDPALSRRPADVVDVDVDERPATGRATVRRTVARRRLGVALVLVASIATVGILLGAGKPNAAPATLGHANGLVAISPDAGRVIGVLPFPGAVAAVGSGSGSVWAASPSASAVSRIDPRASVAVDRIPLGAEPGNVVSGGGAIWIASTVGATLSRIDPETERVTQTIALPGSDLGALAYGAGKVWVADTVARRLFEVDAITGSVRRTLSTDVRPSALAVAGGSLWVAGYDTATIEKVDLASGRTVARLRVGDGPVAVAFSAGSLWVANNLDATVSRVDPARLEVTATIPVGSSPTALVPLGTAVWVADGHPGSVSRIDPRRDRITMTVPVGGTPTSMTSSAGKLWVGVSAAEGSHRGGTLVLVTTQRFASVDPAFYNVALTPQFIGLAYDTLLTFQHTGGDDGVRLVPDLALSIPTPTAGGTAYAFRLRPGIRYSDGRLVRARDFRRAIERLFRLASPGRTFFTGLVGAAGCAVRSSECDLSRGIVTDDRTGTVVFHLTTPDADFPYKLTEQGFSAPIPPGSPDRASGSLPPPGTGPYRLAANNDREVRFVRNRWFREWSHAAQPEGNPDAIVWRFAGSAEQAVDAVSSGQADWLFGLIPPAQYRRLELLEPSQVHSLTQFGVDFAPLNTHVAPFDHAGVRRAFNYAIDRRRLAQLYGGPSFATPTCQPLAPGLPGYRRYCPYTLNPNRSGAWTGPDLSKARRLVSESGTRGERVDVWGAVDESYIPTAVPLYLAGVLRSLGYRVHLHLAGLATITQAQRKRFQLSVDGDWSAEYPAPSAYLPQFFGCHGGTSNGYYCDPRLDREMQRAAGLELRDPARATELWTVIDHRLTDDAPWVPTVNLREVDIVSRRLRNYQYNPIWGFLPDQSWLG